MYTCTSSSFEGIVASMSPEDSWVAKWQRISNLVKGCYAISVQVRDMPNDGDVEGLLVDIRYPASLSYSPGKAAHSSDPGSPIARHHVPVARHEYRGLRQLEIRRVSRCRELRLLRLLNSELIAFSRPGFLYIAIAFLDFPHHSIVCTCLVYLTKSFSFQRFRVE